MTDKENSKSESETQKSSEKKDDAELSASIDRGLDDIKNGRYRKWDGERIRREAKAELTQQNKK